MSLCDSQVVKNVWFLRFVAVTVRVVGNGSAKQHSRVFVFIMKYARIQNRMGATAIAAVLALSSTPLVAQETPSPGTPPVDAPAAESTPALTTEPVADPLAAEPAAESTPVKTTATESETAPAAKPTAKKKATKAVRTAERSATRPAATAPATPSPAASAEPVEATPAPLPMAATEVPPEAAPAAPGPQQNAEIEEALPVAGGAGALLALAGVGMAVRRKKRREDDEMALDRQAYAENTDAALQPIEAEEPAPAWSEPVIQPKSVPVMPAKMETTEIPEGFDTSDFGRHVRAAYRGPTPENPSLSLRKRLKLAGELDRRERKLGGIPTPTGKPVTASLPANERPIMSFGGTVTQAKHPEFQL